MARLVIEPQRGSNPPAAHRRAFKITITKKISLTMYTSIIGLSGPSGVGKSHVARQIAKFTGGDQVSFASNIKLGLFVMGLGADPEDKEGEVYNGHSGRDLMRSLGTEWGRKIIGEDVWVDMLFESLSKSDSHLTVIDDVRFGNEADAIHAAGGIVVELIRDGIEYNYEHETEAGLHIQDIDEIVDCSDSESAVYKILSL